MPAFRENVVAEVLAHRPGITRVRLSDGSRAYALTDLTGPVEEGDAVVVNTTAVDLALGSGGWHVVHWNLTRGDWVEPGPGHLMKLRYTSLQADVGAGEEEGELPDTDLGGTPVVVAGVHSQVPVITAAIARRRPGTRVVYVMTDGAALPIALSDLVVAQRERGLLTGTVTAGHAFGGDVEALNVPAALALARHRLDAEVIVVAMGPGSAGTGSRLGFTALEVAPALDAASWLSGRPIACLRCSEGDPRPRHRPVSHHTLTALEATRSSVLIAQPPGIEPTGDTRHRWIPIDPGDPEALLSDADLSVTTMGRSVAQDRIYFAAAAAAGVLAARLVDEPAEAAGAATAGP